MKHFLLFFASALFSLGVFSQSNDCSSASYIAITANCSSPTPGTTAGATQTIPGCSGNADDDVWYYFIASATSHQINVTGSASFDAVVELFSSGCGTLISLNCMDNTFSGQTETINATGLTVGATYHIRVYNYGAGSGSNNFTICVTNPPPAPANNTCTGGSSGAYVLTVNTTCSYTSGTTVGATQSYAGCSGTADDDVWYSFTANSSSMTITVDPSVSMDAVVELYSGTCGTLTSLSCMDVGFTDGNETINASGLSIGAIYYVRVYDYYSGGGYPFQICVTGTPPSGSPANDACTNAISLPPITAVCNYFTFSNVGGTESPSPVPSSCSGGSGAMDGGFSTSTIADVWFKIVVPASGVLAITAEPNVSSGWISDGTMALYSGACGSLTQIACADDYASYPSGTTYDLLPFIKATGLTPGATVYLRYWGYGGLQGNFGFCVTSVSNDDCSTALYICDLNGYGASTKGYTRGTFPVTGNMYGNNQSATTGAQQATGTNTGGLFGTNLNGQNGSAAGAANYDVTIDNNSWIRFTASGTTVSLSVSVSDCWAGGGIQMQIFKTSDCSSFTTVSNFHESSSTFTLTANGLTAGQDYYLEIDGFGGDLCNYTISVISGVQLPAITATANSVCYGGPVTLTAPNIAAGSYEWLPGGQTTQSITVNPPTTSTYSCVVTGVCGQKQTLTKQIVVNPLPAVAINSGNPVSVCSTHSVTLTASGATSYSWSTGSSASSVTVSPTINTTYTVTGTDANGCVNTSTVNVTVDATPNILVNSPTICKNSSATLIASGASSYSWSPSTGLSGTTGTSVSANPTVTTTYTVTGTAANSCTNSAVATVSVNPLPNITISPAAATVCNGQSASFTANGAANTSSYTWSNGTVNTNTVSVNPALTTTYTVTGTDANSCSSTATATVNVNQLPAITVNNLTLCANQSGNITASGGASYSWNTGATGPVISIVNPTSPASYTVTGTDGNNCSNTAVASLTVNALPQITSSPTITQSACADSTGSITGLSASGSGSLGYSWTNSSNIVVGTAADISNIPAGTYNLTVTDANTCSNVFSYSVTNPGAPASPSVTATPASACEGSSISLSAGTISNATYQWTGPNGFSSSLQNTSVTNTVPASSGTYSVTATVANCTGPAGTVTVIVNPLPVITASSQNGSYCSGNTIFLLGSGGSSYSWTGPNAFTSSTPSPQLTNSSLNMSGTYSLTATDANGCSNSDTARVFINATPVLSSVSASPAAAICEGQNLTLNASATGTPSYLWSGPGGFSSSQQNPVLSNVTIAQSGTYNVSATENNCTSAAGSLTITVNPLPMVTASSAQQTLCAGNAFQLNAGGGQTYSWSGPNGFASVTQNPSLTNTQTSASGVYTVTAVDANNCSDTAQITIVVNSLPAVNANSASSAYCSGSTINLSGSGGGTYSWSGPNGFSSPQQNPSIPNSAMAANGVYTLTVTDNNNCQNSDTAKVTVNPAPVISNTAGDSSCSGSALNLSATTSGGVVNWYSDAGLTQLVGSGAGFSPSGLLPDSLYTFYVQAVNNGCFSSFDSVTAIVHLVNASFTSSVSQGAPPLSVLFTNTSTGFNTGSASIWNFDDGPDDFNYNSSHIFELPGSYNVSLIMTNTQNGCADTATATIIVLDEITISIPNIFTPNGDDVNDYFDVTVHGAKEVEGWIMNRWGQIMFSWSGPNATWDGKALNGQNATDATYFYLIKAMSYGGKKKEFKGYLLLVR